MVWDFECLRYHLLPHACHVVSQCIYTRNIDDIIYSIWNIYYLCSKQFALYTYHNAPIIVTPHPPQVGQRWRLVGICKSYLTNSPPLGTISCYKSPINPLLFPWYEVGKCRKLNRNNFVLIEVWNTGEKIVTSLVSVHLKLWVPLKLEV